VRRPQRAEALRALGCEVHRADVLEPDTLVSALDGASTAYYLVHSMGRGADADFAERDLRAAANFAEAAATAGVGRIVYLGGLGEGSEHLASRHQSGRVLMDGTVPVTYLRAAAVLGAGSESFRTMLYLVRRLPVMVTPRWTSTRTQPIAVDDVLAYLVAAPDIDTLAGREVEIGGPDVTTYAGMMDALARALGRPPRPRLAVPLLTPWLSSLWVGLVTPVDAGVARPLIEGLSTETVVRDPLAMREMDVEPMSLKEAMSLAVRESG